MAQRPKKSAALDVLLAPDYLMEMAGAPAFERGEAYAAEGRVSLTSTDGEAVAALVQGTRRYSVQLWVEDERLMYSCTCPVGDEGIFCKHCVALGLAWRGEQGGSPAASRHESSTVTLDDVRAWLVTLEKADLADMVVHQAVRDDRLLRQLMMRAAAGGPRGLDTDLFKQAINDAVATSGFVDYKSARGYFRKVNEAVGSIEDLLKEGYGAEVIEIAEHAINTVQGKMGYIDDSDGGMYGVLVRLQEMHLKACERAMPDPEDLARRLFQWEIDSDWDVFSGAAETYSDVLGEKGLAVYRSLAEKAWAQMKPAGPGDRDPVGHGRYFAIASIMETLARQTGDVEAIVAVKKRNLTSPYAFLEIAETYKEAGEDDLALEWAERGIEAFPDRSDWRLSQFLADELQSRGRHDEGMAVAWACFAGSPDISGYRMLMRHAVLAGQEQLWREKALAAMRKSAAAAKKRSGKSGWGWAYRYDHSDIVQIFIEEGDIEAAWQEALKGGCSGALWLELAGLREEEYPEDSLRVYQEQVNPTLAGRNNGAYRDAAGILRKVRELMRRLGRMDDFKVYLEAVRTEHRPKRNFMKMLDAEKWE